MLPYGMGRSYGDSCLNPGGDVLRTRDLDHWIDFDPATGRLECEAGATLDELLSLCVPRGWFPPVTPGTRFVTVGGCVANDVHGKNHHRAGTFSRHVLEFELLRSDGVRRICSRTENASWFRATVGGLGLTGLITRVVLRLRPIVSDAIDVEEVRMGGLSDFFSIADASDADHEYTVAWIDALATGDEVGRGMFIRGNHAVQPGPLVPSSGPKLSVPLPAPAGLLNRYGVRAFNGLYRNRFRGERRSRKQHYSSFFYPLDAVGHWNRLYGRRGFYQYQCVVPRGDDGAAVKDILARVGDSGQASFLTVLKLFGDQPPEGLLGFPRPGATLALDLPNRGETTLKLMRELDEIVAAAGGALYPAKDARMRGEDFRAFYPAHDLFAEKIDPAFSSGFWRRVSQS